MGEWTRGRLSAVLDVLHGFAFSSKGMSEQLTGDPIIVSIGNFDYRGGFRFGSTKVREFKSAYPAQFELTPGDLLVVMTCQTPGGEILGLPGIVPCDGRDYLHNQRIGKVVVNETLLDKKFAFYLFLSSDVNRQLVASATGTKILHTAPARIGQVEVNLPPLYEQKAIAAVLGALDDKIAVNERIADAASDLAATLCRPDLFKTVCPLQSIAILSKKQVTPSSLEDSRVAHYSLPAFDAGQIPEHVAPAEIKSHKFVVDHPSVLLSKLNPAILRIWCMEPRELTALASTEFLVLQPNEGVSPPELWAVCNQQDFISQLVGRATGTSNSHQRVRPAEVLASEVVDPRELPDRVREQIQLAVRRSQAARLESVCLVQLRDTLLPKLMSGELRVRDAEKAVEEAT
jgi:type I restriction enzyme S subunit